MSWLEHHSRSEELAGEGDLLNLRGEREQAQAAYRRAADLERLAIRDLEPGKLKTWTITAVSAASLFFMANDYATAERLAHTYLSDERLLPFGHDDLKELLQTMWDEQAKQEEGTSLEDGDIQVTIRGSRVFRGAAPFDLVDGSSKRLVALFHRVAEHELGLPYRYRGPAPKNITQEYQPWILQSAPGSYRFGVTLKGPTQLRMPLLDEPRPDPGHVVTRALDIVAAGLATPEGTLLKLVSDAHYRRCFLTLARDLSPNGAHHQLLEMHQMRTGRRVALTADSRQCLTVALRELNASLEIEGDEPEKLVGVLRGVDLNNDWLRLDTDKGAKTVSKVGETVDDTIGPMVNKDVIVTAYPQPNGSYRYVDIEPAL